MSSSQAVRLELDCKLAPPFLAKISASSCIGPSLKCIGPSLKGIEPRLTETYDKKPPLQNRKKYTLTVSTSLPRSETRKMHEAAKYISYFMGTYLLGSTVGRNVPRENT